MNTEKWLKKYFISKNASKKQACLDIVFCFLSLLICLLLLVAFFLEYPYMFGFSNINTKYFEPLIIPLVLAGFSFFVYSFLSLYLKLKLLKHKRAFISADILIAAALHLALQGYFIFQFLTLKKNKNMTNA